MYTTAVVLVIFQICIPAQEDRSRMHNVDRAFTVVLHDLYIKFKSPKYKVPKLQSSYPKL